MNIENEKMLMWENGNHLGVCPSSKTAEPEKVIATIAHCCREKYGMSAEKSPMFSKNFQESFQNGMTISPDFNAPNAL